AVPGRRHHRRLGETFIDHPAPLHVERGVDLAVARAVVAVAELVAADLFAIKPRPELRAEGLAVPPGEEAQEKNFHRRMFGECRRLAGCRVHASPTTRCPENS